MITIDENSYIVAYWFASDKNDNAWYNVLIKENDKWTWQYTFRYSKDDDPFSGKDEKNIYKWTEPCSEKNEEQIIETLNSLFEIIKIKYNIFSDFFLVKGNAQKFMDICKTKDYMHFKEVDKKDE